MYINVLFFIILCFPSAVYLCNRQVNRTNGTITFLSYKNNIDCIWIFNLTSISNNIHFRALLLTFRHFNTEFGHDELFVGETITDVSNYNSKLFRFSGSKLPDPCLIPLRGDILTRSIWIQFTSDQTNTGSGFIIDYIFLVNQSTPTTTKSRILIDANIHRPLETKQKNLKSVYPYPSGTISSPNHPQNYPDNIICRWHLYHRNAFIRLFINDFHIESHYDTLTLYLGQNLNNRAMILHEWSGNEIFNKHVFIPNDNVYLIFTTDKSITASGFYLHYEIIEKETSTLHLYNPSGIIHSREYPLFLRTNLEYTWIIYMNNSHEIELNLTDIHFDNDIDSLQIITGETITFLTIPKSIRLITTNETKIILRTKHSDSDYQYRGFYLTYQKLNKTVESTNQFNDLPCGTKYSSPNGIIDFNFEIITSFDCLILIQVDDGQNIFLRFNYLNWDYEENYMEIGLFHDPKQNQIFKISDTLRDTSFIANDSQIWIRFYSSQLSLGISTFQLFYSETIQWSTVSPEPTVQILDDHRLFPYRLINLPMNIYFQNLTKRYSWYIEAADDECIQIIFQSFEVLDERRVCFNLIDSFKISQICTNQQFPYQFHHVGSVILSIEPEFVWILIKYDIRIERFKKTTTIYSIDFEENILILTPPKTSDPFIHIEWLISVHNYSSIIIVDIENFDGNIPAELILFSDKNESKSYSLGSIPSTRFSHISFSTRSIFRIIYKSLVHNPNRLFRLNLYKRTHTYFTINDFHYISYEKNQSISKWTIHGRNENCTFLANLFSLNQDLLLQTTANINLSINNPFTHIPSSNFDIRPITQTKSTLSDFIIILYEQEQKNFYRNITLNKTSNLIEINNFYSYYIQIKSTLLDLIDFIIVKAGNDTLIRFYDLNINNSGDFLLNSSSIITKGLSSIIGLRFSIKSLNIKIELQAITKSSIQLRYKGRTSLIQNNNSHHCWITDINLCTINNSQTCSEPCSNWFEYKSSSMNDTKLYQHLWPYALRGSVTLIIENTTIENFEKTIYRNLRQSIAKIIRKFCSIYQKSCLSKDSNSIRADHVIIQSYEEQLDNHRLYVAIFIKDPYRQTIALTNDQFMLALKRNQQEIYQDIKHHINLPSNIFVKNSLDPIWLYGVCLLALLVLIVVILMLITILMKRTYRSPIIIDKNKGINKSKVKITAEQDSLLISSPVRLASEEDEPNSSTYINETESSQTSNSIVAPILSLPPTTTTTYLHRSSPRTSYFHSAIETAIKQRSDDEEPIPFIDDNVSVAPSRKSSACWSDRTSLSSRFGLIWRMNIMRFAAHHRSSSSNDNDEEKRKRKRQNRHPRTARYTIPPAQKHQSNDEV